MAGNNRFKSAHKKQEKKKAQEHKENNFFKETYDYREMQDRTFELAGKTDWDLQEDDNGKYTVNEMEDFSNAVIQMSNIAQKVDVEAFAALDADHYADQVQSCDELDEDEKLWFTIYLTLRAKSNFNTGELRAFETFTLRMAQYDTAIHEIEDLTQRVLDGELEDDAELENKLSAAVESFASEVAQELKKFRAEWDRFDKKFDGEQRVFIEALDQKEKLEEKTKFSINKTRKALQEKVAKDGGKMAKQGMKAGKAVAEGGLGFLKAVNPFKGKKNSLKVTDKFQEEFANIQSIMKDFPSLRTELDGTLDVMRTMTIETLDPLLKDAEDIGNLQVTVIRQYDFYSGALDELERRYKEKYLPVAKEYATDAEGDNLTNRYKKALSVLDEVAGKIQIRGNRIRSNHNQAYIKVSVLKQMTETLEDYKNRAHQACEETLPGYMDAMSIVTRQLRMLESGKMLAEMENTGADIYQAMLEVAELSHKMTSQLSDLAIDNQSLQAITDRSNKLQENREQARLERYERNAEERLQLEDSRDALSKSKRDAEEGKTLLTDGTKKDGDKKSAPKKPAADFDNAAPKAAPKSTPKAVPTNSAQEASNDDNKGDTPKTAPKAAPKIAPKGNGQG